MLKKMNRYKTLILWAYRIFAVVYSIRRIFRLIRRARFGYLTTRTVGKLLRSS